MTDDHAVEGTILRTTSRDRRRRLVAAMYLCLAAVVLVFGFAESEWWFVLATGFLLVAFAFYAKLLFPIMQELTEKKDRELDEREIRIRDRAYHRAYRLLGMLLLLTVLYAMLAASPELLGGTNLPVPTAPGGFVLLILLFSHLAVSLPAAVVAWTEPDPSFDED